MYSLVECKRRLTFVKKRQAHFVNTNISSAIAFLYESWTNSASDDNLSGYIPPTFTGYFNTVMPDEQAGALYYITKNV